MKRVLIFLFCFVALASCKSPRQKMIDSIAAKEQKLLSDSTRMLNSTVAEEVLKSYNEFIEKFPSDSSSANFLFKAADLSNGMRKYTEAIGLYGKFMEKFPDNRNVPSCLFLQAFIYDSNMHDQEKAKQLYAEFLQKFPFHELAPSAKASLEQINLGLTDEQLIKMFEAKQDSLAKK